MQRSDAIRVAHIWLTIEKMLWFQLRARRFHTLKFNRQFPIEWKKDNNQSNFFIVDFHCHEYRLIIEVDGQYHSKPEVKLRDQERSEILQSMGYNIIRFNNEQIEKDINSVKDRL